LEPYFMVDLFGKKKLEERILELEAEKAGLEKEKDDLLRTLEKRDEKIKSLSAATQAANLALKAAEKKAADASSSPPPAQARSEKKLEPKNLSSREMSRLLDRLAAQRSPQEDLLTAYYPGPIPDDTDIPDQIKKKASALKSRRGFIILHSPQLFCLLLIPPFPLRESYLGEGSSFFLQPIRELMEAGVLVVSAHAGDTFLGVSLGREGFQIEEFVQSQVMGRHSKGGWSQKRFERLREEDVKNHIDQAKEKLADMMNKYKVLLNYAVLSGEESMVLQMASIIDLPLVERAFSRHDHKEINSLLEEVYGFACVRVDI
jgi:hypothetical protein